MSLFKQLKELFTPTEEKKPGKKTTKRIKRKPPVKVKKKASQKRKITVKKKSQKKPLKRIRVKPKIQTKKKQKTAQKKSQRKTRPKIKKKPLKKHPPKKSSQPLTKPSKEKMIGAVTHYFGKISVGIVKLKSTLQVGDKIHIKGAHDDFTQLIKSMQVNHKDILQAKKGDEIGIKVTQAVHKNDKVYKPS